MGANSAPKPTPTNAILSLRPLLPIRRTLRLEILWNAIKRFFCGCKRLIAVSSVGRGGEFEFDQGQQRAWDARVDAERRRLCGRLHRHRLKGDAGGAHGAPRECHEGTKRHRGARLPDKSARCRASPRPAKSRRRHRTHPGGFGGPPAPHRTRTALRGTWPRAELSLE